jgi:membrane protein
VKSLFKLVVEAAKKWNKDGATRLGAALSYYAIFAIPPLVVIFVLMLGLWLGQQNAQKDITGELQDVLGKNAAVAIQSAVSKMSAYGKGTIATVIAIATLVLTATGLFLELQGALNWIWGVEQCPNSGIWGFIRSRLTSFVIVIASGALMMASVATSTAVNAFSHYLKQMMPGLDVIWGFGDILVSFLVVTLLFALIYKVLPDVKIAWRDVWIGALMTSALFSIGKFALGLYLAKNSTVSAYGAAGALILVLLWVYYSAQIMFFGAELTQIQANRFGRKLEPKEHARWIGDVERLPT